MNDATGKIGSVLLPTAKVALHIKDSDIREAAKLLAQDWRFARVTFEINDGSIETAIAAYESSPSPELVIVETSTIEEGFTDRLGMLAGNCSGNTSAVVIGPVNDVYLYRKLIDMGVSDYLVRPVTAEVLAQVISKTLIEKFGAPESRLIAMIGAKGGVGTSTIAQGFAWNVSSRLEEKTIILDAAGGWSYLSVGLGTEPMTNFTEMTRLASSTDEAAFKRMLFGVSDKLSVVATGADSMLDDHVSAEAFETIVNRLMIAHPVVIVDLSGAPPSVKKSTMARAHEIIVVSTPTLPSLRAARTLMQEIKNLRGDSGDNISLILNKVGRAAGMEVGKSDIEKALERKADLVINYAEKAFAAAEAQGKNLGEIKGAEDIASSILDFARKLLNVKQDAGTETKADNSLLGGLLGKFKGKA